MVGMDRRLMTEYLAQAERHVADGEHQIACQREIIDELERDGQDTRMARDALAHFEEMQALHLSDRDRLRTELQKYPPYRPKRDRA
jgi:hypothetical protein